MCKFSLWPCRTHNYKATKHLSCFFKIFFSLFDRTWVILLVHPKVSVPLFSARYTLQSPCWGRDPSRSCLQPLKAVGFLCFSFIFILTCSCRTVACPESLDAVRDSCRTREATVNRRKNQLLAFLIWQLFWELAVLFYIYLCCYLLPKLFVF